MHILSLILLCIYTPTAFSAASSRTRHRRKNTTTMSLGQYTQHIQQAEHQKLLDCIKKHETYPGSNSSDFLILQTHYEMAQENTQSLNKKKKWQRLLTQCNKRMNIMLDIEATEQNSTTEINERINSAAMQERHWLTLRDTYKADTKHYTFYDSQARLINDQYKKMILNRDISHLLSLPSVSHNDYKNLCETADALFGDRSEQILSQLPEVTTIAARSIQTSLAKKPNSKRSQPKIIIRGIKPNNLRQAKLTNLYKQVASHLNDEHLKPEERTSTLAKLYTHIAASSSGIEKLQAAESATHYKRLHQQITLAKNAHQLSRSLNDEIDFHILKNILTELRNTYATIDPHYEKINHKISMVDRKLWYHMGDLDRLIEAASNDTDASCKKSTLVLIDRLTKENIINDLHTQQATLQETRAAYVDLLNTYKPNKLEYDIYLNRIRQLDLMIEIEQIDSLKIDDLTYFTENIRLRTELAHTCEADAEEHIVVLQELEMYNALKTYTEAYNLALDRTNQPITEENVTYFHALIKELHAHAQHVNKHFATKIKTDWMEDMLAEYTQYITYYETIADLKLAESSSLDSHNTQQDLLRKIINSSITSSSAKKESLIKLINLTDDLTSKIRIIRDELFALGTLDTNEQLHWNKELAQHNLTRKIRSLREKLQTASIDEQISLNKELAACYAQRKAHTDK